MQVILNYKSFYGAANVGVIDNRYTPFTRMFFFPVFDINWGIQPVDEEGTPYEADNKHSGPWCKGEEPIPVNIRTAVSRKDTLDAIIKYYNSDDFTEQLSEATEDEMYEAIIDLVKNCEISDAAKKKLLKVYDSGKHLEFLARVFQRAILGNNKVAPKSRSKRAASKESESVQEFKNLVLKQKPKTVVPKTVQPQEMVYVTQLYAAYETTKQGLQITCPEDLDSVDYREHFEHQRMTYYMAETVHHELRDSVMPGDNDPFDDLKDEIELGIFEIKRRPYYDAVQKIDAVVGKAAELSLSEMVNRATNEWIGVGEKKGVCHMLVNDERLKWVSA